MTDNNYIDQPVPFQHAHFFLIAQCDLVVPMYIKKSLKFVSEFEEDLGVAKMAQSLKKLLFRPKNHHF